MLGRALILALAVPWADTPPEYATFGRQQAVDRSIANEARSVSAPDSQGGLFTARPALRARTER